MRGGEEVAASEEDVEHDGDLAGRCQGAERRCHHLYQACIYICMQDQMHVFGVMSIPCSLGSVPIRYTRGIRPIHDLTNTFRV